MQKNEFEKQVQQKMEELKLHPSDSVWLNIEVHISRKKRRRLAWVFFPLLFMCLCGGYWLMHPVTKLKSDRQNKLTEDITKKDSPAEMQTSRQSEKDIAALNQTKKISNKSFVKRSEKKSLLKQNDILKTVLTKKGQGISTTSETKTVEPDDVLVKSQNLLSKDREDLRRERTIISDQINETSNVRSSSNADSSQIKIIIDSVNNDKEAQTRIVTSKQAKLRKPYKTNNAWTWGLNFSVGISGVPSKFLGSLDKSFAAADALYLSSPAQNNFAPLPTKIRSSTGVIAGLHIEKNISKHKMITAGINYKLFSAKNKVGEKNDSSQQYNLNNAVNNYHHYYHFIELPISLKVQISSKNIPLFWDGGISISQLISSNALQFNNNSIGYYNNNSLFNTSQIGFHTGFSTLLFSDKNTSTLIGPYIYYGTTKIAEEGLYKNQHFSFIGLRSQILFKK